MIKPQDQRERSELFERLWLYRWAYEHRSRYDSEPIMPIAMAIAYARSLMLHHALPQRSRHAA